MAPECFNVTQELEASSPLRTCDAFGTTDPLARTTKYPVPLSFIVAESVAPVLVTPLMESAEITGARVSPVPVDQVPVLPVPVDQVPVLPVPVEPVPVDQVPVVPVPESVWKLAFFTVALRFPAISSATK